jgi:hypothetical protein
MKNPPRRHRDTEKRTYQCFVCEGSIEHNEKLSCTVIVQRGTIDFDSKLKPRQFIYAHAICLKKLIPITEYSFPDLKK